MSSNRARRAFGFRVGQVAGIDIHVDLSLAIVFALITFSLGNGLFPSWHPDWSLFVTWATALVARRSAGSHRSAALLTAVNELPTNVWWHTRRIR